MSTPLISPATLGDLIKRESDPDYTREIVTLKAGTAYPLGAVLGRITATGVYALSPAASTTGIEGAEIANAVLLHPVPNGADYSLWLLPTYVRQEDGHMRGILPGMLWMPQDRPYSDQTIVDNVVGQEGRRFLLVRTQYSSETEGAQIAFDITGPWR